MGVEILYLMATEAEYLDHLKARITPEIIGVGPVEAAANTTRLLATLKILPNYVILLGSSGSATLAQGSVYQATSVSYRDMDASPIGFEKGRTPFLDQPATIPLEPIIKALPQASLSTGGNIVLTHQFDELDADMVDMESYAVKRVCQMFDVPLIVLRGVSDGPEELKRYDDWTKLLPEVDQNLANALDIVLETLNAQ
jgi:adenosylhomocysteine nucleosidase